MASLQSVFSDVLPGFLPVKNTCCSTGNYMASPQYVFSDAVQDCFCVKVMAQGLQAYGLSPVCIV